MDTAGVHGAAVVAGEVGPRAARGRRTTGPVSDRPRRVGGGGRRGRTARSGGRWGPTAGAEGGGGRRGATVGRAAGAGGDGGGRTAERARDRAGERKTENREGDTRFLMFNFRRPRQVAAEISTIFGGYVLGRRK